MGQTGCPGTYDPEKAHFESLPMCLFGWDPGGSPVSDVLGTASEEGEDLFQKSRPKAPQNTSVSQVGMAIAPAAAGEQPGFRKNRCF